MESQQSTRVIPIKSLETVLENGGTEDEFFERLVKQPYQDLDERLEQEYKQSKGQLDEIYNRVVEEKWNIPQLLEHMFPNASQSEREYYLWEKTGYPAFYSPRPG